MERYPPHRIVNPLPLPIVSSTFWGARCPIPWSSKMHWSLPAWRKLQKAFCPCTVVGCVNPWHPVVRRSLSALRALPCGWVNRLSNTLACLTLARPLLAGTPVDLGVPSAATCDASTFVRSSWPDVPVLAPSALYVVRRHSEVHVRSLKHLDSFAEPPLGPCMQMLLSRHPLSFECRALAHPRDERCRLSVSLVLTTSERRHSHLVSSRPRDCPGEVVLTLWPTTCPVNPSGCQPLR